MERLLKYRPRQLTPVLAIQIDLDLECFRYAKWGGEQQAKRGDWLVNNDGSVYTVSRETFERTYRMDSPGVYTKIAPVWARRASEAGSVESEEGETHFEAGDFVVFHNEDDHLGWAVSPERFHRTYERDEEGVKAPPGS